MDLKRIRRITLWLKTMEGLSGAWMYASYVLFMEAEGVVDSDKFTLNAIFMVGCLILDPPTGRLGDKVGYMRVYVAGLLMTGIGYVVYGLGSTFVSFVIAELIVAGGYALRSEALDSWLRNKTDDEVFHSERTRANQLMRIGTIITGSLGVFLGGRFGWSVPWFLGGLNFVLLAFSTQLLFRNGSDVRSFTWADLKASFLDITGEVMKSLKRANLRPVFLIYAVMAGLFQPVNMLWSLILRDHGLGTDETAWFWVIVCISLMVGSEWSHRIKTMTLRKMSVSIIIVGTGTLMSALTLIFDPTLIGVMIIWFVVHEVGRGLLQELLKSYQNERISNDERSFVNSVISSARTFGSAVGLVVFGHVIRLVTDPLQVWIISASCMLAFGVAVLFFKQR